MVYLYFIIFLQLAVMAFNDTEAIIPKITEDKLPVRKIGYRDHCSWLQISRSQFVFNRPKVGIVLILDLGQLLPMGIPEVSGDDVEGGLMRHAVVGHKAQQALQRGGTDMHSRPSLNVQRQKLAVRG